MFNFLFHHLPKGVDLVLFGAMFDLYGPQLVLLFAMRRAARCGSYERRNINALRSYSPPAAFAFGAVAFVGWITSLTALLPDSLWTPVFQRWAAPGHPGMVRDLLLAACVVGIACWGAICWLRRCTLTLNLSERTYRSVDLSSLSLKAQSGSWRDIAGVHIYSSNRRRPKEGFAYFVGLKLPGGRKVYSVLGGFKRQEQAEAFAAKTAQELGLPLLSDTVRQAEKGRTGRGF